jgi:two-component system, cell cycle response regulator
MKTTSDQAACVLAIDDSPEVLALLAVRLKPEGLRLVTGQSYEEGLALAMHHQPDLILLDVDMPEHSGLDLCRRLKSHPSTANIPVIFLTASDDVDTKVHGFDLGAVDYVTKPFHPAELRARVRAALRMKRAQDMLTYKAQIDALTGLRNRAYLDERLEEELRHSLRSGRPLSLVMMDLDHFKSLNDSYGHPFGDLVLQRVGDFLTRTVRSCDVACRYGGEELAVILTDTSLADAHAVAERIRIRVRELELAPRGKPLMVTASFGIAEALELAGPTNDMHPSAIICAADEALYIAKREGRDCVRLHAAGTRETLVPKREEEMASREESSFCLAPAA